MASDEDSSGMLSRVKRNSATTVRMRTASPCTSGEIASNRVSLPGLDRHHGDRRPYPSSHLFRNKSGTMPGTRNCRDPIVETLEVIDVPVRDAGVPLE